MPKYFDTKAIKELAHPTLITLGIHTVDFRFDYEAICNKLYNRQQNNYEKYLDVVRELSKKDFFFFSYYVLDLPLDHPYLIARCYETQDNENEKYVYLSAARDHYKSVLNTIAFPLWRIIKNPNETFAIISFEKEKAVGQLKGIKQQCDTNTFLYDLWPEIFIESRRASETAGWDVQKGLFLKRTSTVKEPTFSAHGFIEGTPVSMHFDHIIIDDPVTEANTNNTSQIAKVKDAYKKLTGIATRNGKFKTITTRYDVNDISADLLNDDRYKKIIIPAEVDEEGKACRHGIPVFFTAEELDDRCQSWGEYDYYGQMLQDPTAAKGKRFKKDWIQFYDELPSNLYKYIFVDPATTQNSESDYTAMAVIGTSHDHKFYLVDLVRDKVDVFERFNILSGLNKQYEPEMVYYEAQNGNTDLEVFDREMLRLPSKDQFIIDRVHSNETGSKVKRIKNLGAEFRRGNFLLPRELVYTQQDNGEDIELIETFINVEYLTFPANKNHDDMLDAMSWVMKVPDIEFPPEKHEANKTKTTSSFNPFEHSTKKESWMSSYAW